MADHLTTLIQAVDAADSSDSLLEAVEDLAEARLEGAIPTLIAALSYNNPGAAVASVDGLIQLGEPAMVALLEQLDRHNYTARAWATRAVAGIGDPRGLATLLEAATSDIAMSVRRAAARGLGAIKWHYFPPDLLSCAQQEALSALLYISQNDEEWVVRYAAIVGLQSVADANPALRKPLQRKFSQIVASDDTITVCARAQMAKNCLLDSLQPSHEQKDSSSSPLSEADWHRIRHDLETYQQNKEISSESLSLLA